MAEDTARAARREGKPIDRRTQNTLNGKVALTEGEAWYLRQFWDLSTCRAVGMSVGRIPWTAIYMKARHDLKLGPVALDAFVFVIREMDDEYMRFVAAQQEASAPEKKPGTSQRKGRGR